MKKPGDIDTVSSWYQTSGFYAQLVSMCFETIQPFFYGKTLLEVGPADGAMTKLLTPHFSHVTLLEPSRKYQRALQKQFPKATIIPSLAENYHAATTFDTILMSHVLEHIHKPTDALENMKKAMHDKSRLILIVPNAHSFHRHLGVSMGLLKTIHTLHAYDKKLGHQRVYDRILLRTHINHAGLRVLSEGGVMIKPLSNTQMESWNPKIVRGLFMMGKSFPDSCAELYAVCIKNG